MQSLTCYQTLWQFTGRGQIHISEKTKRPPRKEQSLYSGEDSELEAELGDYYENEKAWPEAYSRRGINSVVS